MTKSDTPAPARDQIPQREILGGTAAMLVAMLMLAVFTGMLHSGSVLGKAPATTVTPKPLTPTTTPGPLTAAHAWGNAITSVPLQLADGTQFSPTDVLPDGGALVGLALTRSGPTATDIVALLPTSGSAPAGNEALQLYTMPVGANVPNVKTDGSYVVWVGGINVTGGPGLTRQIVGYFDRTQKRAVVILRDTPGIVVDPYDFAVEDGYFVWTKASTPSALYFTNLATGGTNYFGLDQPLATDTGNPLQLAWPNVMYVTADHQAHLRNLQTGQVTDLPQVKITPFDTTTGTSTQLLLTSDTLYWSQLTADGASTAIMALAHPDQPNAVSSTIATVPGVMQSLAGITDRLIVYTANWTNLAWDRTQQRAIVLAKIPTGFGALDLGLQGTTLWYVADSNGQPVADLVNLAHLP